MTIRAKFYVNAITQFAHGSGSKVELRPVTTGSEENKSFWHYTPSGMIEMQISQDATGAIFEVGQEYYVDFAPATESDDA